MPWTDSLRRTRAGPDDVFRSRAGGAVSWVLARRSGVVLLAVDQLGEPADLAVDGVQAVPLQFEGVAVELLLGAAQRVHEPVALTFDGAPPALEDAQPHVDRGVPEE